MARGKGIYRRGSVYWIRFAGTDGRMRFESSHSDSFKVAELLLNDRRKAVDDGQDPTPAKITNSTFAELSVPYIAWAERQKSARKKKDAINILLKKFGTLPLKRFTTRIIEEYQTELLKEGNQSIKDDKKRIGGKRPATVNRYMATLKHMIRKAVEWEMVDEETLRRVRRAKQLPEDNRRLRYLTGDEARTLVAKCADHIRPVVVCALNTGMRLEEILSLEWDKHIDLKHGYILLDKTKNGERRQIPVSPTLKETLDGIVRRVDIPHVFLYSCKDSEGETKTGRLRYIRTGFNSACRRAGIKDFHFHDLRHTFASHLVMGGVDLATVKELLGHRNFSMTLRYSHLAPAHKTAALAVLESALNGGKGSANYTKTIQSGENSPTMAEAAEAISPVRS